ncbi:MAG TPA: nucleotidyltransferase domain-containing protein [Micromonosporaceae bacterium]
MAYGRKIAAAASDSGLIGAYVHGSLALGGFRPERSDVDLLIVISDPLPVERQRRLGEALLGSAYPLIGTALELSVITAATAAELGSCAFEVHVATPATIVTGAGRDGGAERPIGRAAPARPGGRVRDRGPVQRRRSMIRKG